MSDDVLTDVDIANFIALRDKIIELHDLADKLGVFYFKESVNLSVKTRRLETAGKILDDMWKCFSKPLLLIETTLNDHEQYHKTHSSPNSKTPESGCQGDLHALSGEGTEQIQCASN